MQWRKMMFFLCMPFALKIIMNDMWCRLGILPNKFILSVKKCWFFLCISIYFFVSFHILISFFFYVLLILFPSFFPSLSFFPVVVWSKTKNKKKRSVYVLPTIHITTALYIRHSSNVLLKQRESRTRDNVRKYAKKKNNMLFLFFFFLYIHFMLLLLPLSFIFLHKFLSSFTSLNIHLYISKNKFLFCYFVIFVINVRLFLSFYIDLYKIYSYSLIPIIIKMKLYRTKFNEMSRYEKFRCYF